MQAPFDSNPVPYMERTRNYYRALGYEPDYVWAHFADVPFARPAKPLSAMNVALISTAGPSDRSNRDERGRKNVALISTAGPSDRSNRDERGRKHVWSCDIAATPATFDTDLAWDREATHMEDRETFLPIEAMRKAAASGVIASVARRFHGAPTEYSHRKTMETDAPEILRRLREDGADAALLVAI